MQLFDNFDRLPPDYIPNNMFPRIPEVNVSINEDTMHPVFGDGKLKGYWWNWGDKITLEIKNQVHIELPAGAMITYNEGEEPTAETVGDFPGQKYYNLKDIRSWTLDSVIDDDFNPDNGLLYVWVEDAQFTHPKHGKTPYEVEMPFRAGDQIVVQLLNFRKELISEEIFDTPECTWQLTPELSRAVLPGIYYLNIYKQNVYEELVSDLRLTNCYEIYVKGF